MVYARSDAFGMHIFVHGVFCVYMQSGRIPPSGIPGRLFCFIGNSVEFPMKQKASGRMRSSRKGRPLRDSARARRVRLRTQYILWGTLMKRYIIGRVLFVIPIMLILSFFTFSLNYLSPSDPVTLKYERMGAVPDREQVEKLKEEMGLNDPLIVQYVSWLSKVLHGDLGESYYYGTSVWAQITKRVPNTLILTAATLLLTILFAVPLGILCAVCQNGWVDYLLRFISFFGVSMPSFWVGMLLMYAFGVKLKLLPIMGSGDLRHLILPSVTLAFWMTSIYIRRVRGSMLEEMNKDYLTGGLALGYTKAHVIWTQVLPNSLLSVITMFGMSIGSLLGGATIVETIFEWQGVGKMAVEAISIKDFPIIQGYVLWMAIIYVTINLLVDLSYQILDPRIRLGGKNA